MLKGFLNGKKLIMFVVLLFVMFVIKGCPSYASISSNLPVSTISDTFPASYNSYINELKSKHPNWVFKAVNTGLDWDTVVYHETYECNLGISAIHESYGDEWKKDGGDNYVDGPYVVASIPAVKFVLDPRNSLIDDYVFQFEYLGYSENISASVINKILSNVMTTTCSNKYKNAGNWLTLTNEAGEETTYANLICDIARVTKVSAVYIATLIMQETSGDIVNNGSINGSVPGYEGVYNYFNIGSSPSYVGASDSVINGLKASAAKGWTTPYLGMKGGVEEIKRKWIDFGQYTIYFKKFDVNNPYGNAKALMAYQYQTNILAPRSESKITYNAYKSANMLEDAFTFYIPVYNNMPSVPAQQPINSEAYYADDNTKVYLDDKNDTGVPDTFTIRSTPESGITSNIVCKITETQEGYQNRTVITRLKKGINTGWDYIEFYLDGVKKQGYVWSAYVYTYDYTKVTGVTLNSQNATVKVGNTLTLSASVAPSEAMYKGVTWQSSDTSVATVNSSGVVTGVKVGNAVISAITEDGGYIANCNISVTSKDPSITLDNSKYTLPIGKSLSFGVTIADTDVSEYDTVISDTNIAIIENGKIKGVSRGETKITVTLKGTQIKSEAIIKVIEVSENLVTIDDSLSLSEDIITKINPGMKVSEILAKITYAGNIEVKNILGNTISGNDLIGTGSKINIKDAEGNTIYTYTAVIYGDVDGDGNIYATDYVRIKNHIMDLAKLTGVFAMSADVDRDNNIYATDYVRIKNYIMGTGTISQ